MELIDIMSSRSSVRRYAQEEIPEEKINMILKAGLLSASSKAIRPWDFIVVRNKETLKFLADCRDGGHAKMLAKAGCAIVVIADSEKSDVWIEDCSIAMSNMHLMADSLGVGSCWVQGRLRNMGEISTETYVRKKLQFPETHRLEALLSLGLPYTKPKQRDPDNLPDGKIHWEVY